MPGISLSAGGEYLCLRGPDSDVTSLIGRLSSNVAYHVLSTEKLGEITTNSDADFVTEASYNSIEWNSTYRPIWHHSQPVLAWHAKVIPKESRRPTFDGIRWYDAQTKTTREFSTFDGEIKSIRSMPFGWTVQDACSVLAFDFQGEYLGRWLDGSPPSATPQEPQLNTWIDAAGTVKTVLSPSGFTAVLLRGNRFTSTSLESFQSEFGDQLPKVVDVAWE